MGKIEKELILNYWMGPYATIILKSCELFSCIKWSCNSICLVLTCKIRFFTNFKAFWLLQINNVGPWTLICSSSNNVLIHVIFFAASLNVRYFAFVQKEQPLITAGYSMLLDNGTTWRSISWLINVCPSPSPSLHPCRRSVHLLHHKEKKMPRSWSLWCTSRLFWLLSCEYLVVQTQTYSNGWLNKKDMDMRSYSRLDP